MRHQVIAKPIAGGCEWVRADDPLNRRQPDPVAANHGRRHRLRSLCRRRLNLLFERPHCLRFLLFRETPIDAGDFLDDALSNRML
jgi:hypothetical protein